MSFEITKERIGKVLVLRIDGQFLMGQELRTAKQHMSDLGDTAAILVNLEACTKVDSAGLGELLMWYSMAAREGRKLLLCNAKETVKQMIKIARVDGILLLAKDRESALAELTGN